MFKIVGIASTTLSVKSSLLNLKSLAKRSRQSINSPTISIPVNPEPQTTKVNIALRFSASGSMAAFSTMSSMCFLIFKASSNDQSVKPFSLTPGVPKSFGSPPIPMIKWSNGYSPIFV